MALTKQAPQKQTQIPGFKVEIGTLIFTSTDADGELAVNMREIHGWFFTPQGAATDEQVDFNETIANGVIAVPATGTVTVRRTGASKTSGLKVTYLVFGK